MAYQARVVMDRIELAIKHTTPFAEPCISCASGRRAIAGTLWSASNFWIGGYRFDRESPPGQKRDRIGQPGVTLPVTAKE